MAENTATSPLPQPPDLRRRSGDESPPAPVPRGFFVARPRGWDSNARPPGAAPECSPGKTAPPGSWSPGSMCAGPLGQIDPGTLPLAPLAFKVPPVRRAPGPPTRSSADGPPLPVPGQVLLGHDNATGPPEDHPAPLSLKTPPARCRPGSRHMHPPGPAPPLAEGLGDEEDRTSGAGVSQASGAASDPRDDSGP